MQDVCVSFWPENGPEGDFTNDMIAKVTDICSTDPSDPSHCATPSDIKVDRAKVQVMYAIPVPGIDNAEGQVRQGDLLAFNQMLGERTCNPILLPSPTPARPIAFTIVLTPIRRFPSPPTETTGGLNPLSPTAFNGTSTPRGSR